MHSEIQNCHYMIINNKICWLHICERQHSTNYMEYIQWCIHAYRTKHYSSINVKKPPLSGELHYAWPQLGHKMALSSRRKPCPTKDTLHWLQTKQSLCQCRSSNDTNFVQPRPSGINTHKRTQHMNMQCIHGNHLSVIFQKTSQQEVQKDLQKITADCYNSHMQFFAKHDNRLALRQNMYTNQASFWYKGYHRQKLLSTRWYPDLAMERIGLSKV